MSSTTDGTITPKVPVKDPIVERAYDYAKWHIALYAVILALLVKGDTAGIGAFFRDAAIVLMGVAGIAAGTLASCLSRREYWGDFLQTRTFPLVPDAKNAGFSMQAWLHIQHAALWLAIGMIVMGAVVHVTN